MNPLVLIGGAVLAWLVSQNGDAGDMTLQNVENVIDDTLDEVQDVAADMEVAVTGTMPEAAAMYLDAVNAAAAATGWDPYVLFGIGWRETNWGTSKQLHQPGPAGTGDFAVRSPARAGNMPRTQIVGGLYGKWRNPNGVAPGSFIVPDDSLGFGRGLMQIDWPRAQKVDWANPETNIELAAKILSEKRSYIASHYPGLTPDELVRASVAAYNTGEGNVVKSLTGKQARLVGRSYATDGIEIVDLSTVAKYPDVPVIDGYGGNYSAAVMATAAGWKGGNV